MRIISSLSTEYTLLFERQMDIIAAWKEKVIQRLEPDDRFMQIEPRNMEEFLQLQLHYLIHAVSLKSSKFYLHIIDWIKNILISRGIKIDNLLTINQIFKEVILSYIPSQLITEVTPLLKSGLDRLENATIIPSTMSIKESTNAKEIGEYLQYLLEGDRYRSIEYLHSLSENGMEIKDILIGIIQPSQYEIGRLWEINQIKVPEEHLATAINQYAISQLIYPKIFKRSHPAGRTIVSMCPGRELHQLGIRIIADLFTLEGWDSIYLGNNTPVDDAVAFILKREPDIVALSATMITTVRSITEMIKMIRERATFEVRIIVGGYPFLLNEDLWKVIGADATAKNAENAIEIARTWFG